MAETLYIATVVALAIGAVALRLMMPGLAVQKLPGLAWLGVVLGAATLGGLWLFLARELPDGWGIAGGGWAMVYYYVFSGIAIAAAVRVITHTKPVYSALWFVLVVLASAGMFLLLGAEFVAFAMVIVYGGAILVTYVFVIMLAAQAGDPSKDEQAPAYDRLAWEPIAAIAAGFLLIAVVLSALMPRTGQELTPNRLTADQSDSILLKEILPQRPAQRLALATATQSNDETTQSSNGITAQAAQVTNVERIGLDLFQGNVLGLELAGVILLVSLVGAVVIAKQKVEEEEVR